MNTPAEPTPDQCSSRARLDDFHGCPAYACWYPQMGGYVGKAVVVLTPDQDGCVDSCFEAYVWHDGEFPFRDDDTWKGPARHIHHCMPSQFVEFGQLVLGLQRATLAAVSDEPARGGVT